MSWLRVALMICCLAPACDAADDDAGIPDGIPIGVNGGTLRFPDGGGLTIPAGALSETVFFEVTPIPTVADARFFPSGPFYRLSPNGVTFARPVILELPLRSGPGDRFVAAFRPSSAAPFEARPAALDLTVPALRSWTTQTGDVAVVSWNDDSGACCADDAAAACTTVSPQSSCDGVFLGRGVACDVDGMALCGGLSCCNGDVTAVPAGQCPDGTIELDLASCGR